MSLWSDVGSEISAVVKSEILELILPELLNCQKTIESCSGPSDALALLSAVETALAIPGPNGLPSVIEEQGQDYLAAAKKCETVASDLKSVAKNQLPTSWKGDVAETASDAVAAVSLEVGTTKTTIERAGHALVSWAADLETAQRADRNGRKSLDMAKEKLGVAILATVGAYFHPDDFAAARRDASDGIAALISAAKDAKNSGSTTARLLNQLANEARAERVHGKGLDPLDAVVLAAEKNPGGPADAGDILTATQLNRGSQLLDGMSEADRQQFEKLLAQAKSSEEAAYLWKALAAGHSMSEIQQFSGLIHPYGSDPTWLAEHLSPTFTSLASAQQSSSNLDLTYMGKDVTIGGYTLYSQGNIGDCVAASTVVAQAGLDPTYMLRLTTGNQPGAQGADSPEAFQQRLQDAYTSQYVEGQKADGSAQTYPQVDDGIGDKGIESLANSDLGRATGTSYHYVALNGSDANQNALPQIESAVDSGKPVPVDVVGAPGGHQMMIIGHDGDKLEIYNPWGFTSWVTESQFVNNQLGSLTPGDDLRTVTAVTLPS